MSAIPIIVVWLAVLTIAVMVVLGVVIQDLNHLWDYLEAERKRREVPR